MIIRKTALWTWGAVLGIAGACNGGDSSDGTTSWTSCDEDTDCPSDEVCRKERCEPGVRAEAGVPDASTNGSADAGTDGSVDAGTDGSADAGTEASTEGGLVPSCDPASPGCTCAWSPAERLASVPDGFGNVGTHLVADRSGGAVLAWGTDEEFGQGPLSVRTLDPATETWGTTVQLLPHAATASLVEDRAERLFLLAVSSDPAASGLMAATFDPSARTFAPLSPVHPGTGATGQLVSSESFTYVVDHPVVRRFQGGAWGPSTATEAELHYEGSVVAADSDGDLVAAWRDFTIASGPRPYPLAAGISAAFYDASTAAWTVPEKLSATGGGVGLSIDGDGAAHVSWVDDTGQLRARRRSPASGEWTAAEDIPVRPFLMDADGELQGLHTACRDDWFCTTTVGRFDRATGTWSSRVLREAQNVFPGVIAAIAGHRALLAWPSGCDDDLLCSPIVAHFEGTDWVDAHPVGGRFRWNGPPHSPALAVGEDGTAVLAWVDEAPFPGVDPSTLRTMRYDPGRREWSTPIALDQADVGGPIVVVDSRGFTTAVWQVSLPNVPPSSASPAELWSSRYACRTFTPVGTPRDGGTAEPDLLPQPACLETHIGAGCGSCRWSAPLKVGAGLSADAFERRPPVVAVADDGTAAVVWADLEGVLATLRSPDGTWGVPSLVRPYTEGGTWMDPAAVVLEGGAVLLLLEDEWSSEWAFARPGGDGGATWSVPRVLAPGPIVRVQAVPGAALVTTLHTPVGGGGNLTDRVTRFDLGSGTWTPPSPLWCGYSSVVTPSGDGVVVHALGSVAADDAALCARPPLLLRTELRDGAWSAPTALATTEADPGAQIAPPLPDGDGNVDLAWTFGDTVHVARYDVLTGLGPVEQVGAAAPCSQVPDGLRIGADALWVWSSAGGVFGCDPGATAGIWASRRTASASASSAVRVSAAAAWHAAGLSYPGDLAIRLSPTAGGAVVTWGDVEALRPALETEMLLGARWSSASGSWSTPSTLDGPVAFGALARADRAGNVLYVWTSVEGGEAGSWTLRTTRYDVAAGAFAASPVDLAPHRGYRSRKAYALEASPGGTALAAWTTEESVYASVWECGD